MAFVNLSLMFGGMLIAVPIILHLVMRQKPKLLVFPAIRFLKRRRETNRRTLRLRQWLLLLLRCGVVTALAATLARPSVATAMFGNWLLGGLFGLLFLVASGLCAVAAIQKKGRLVIGGLAATAFALFIALSVFAVRSLSGAAQGLIGDQEAPVAAVMVIDTSPRMEYRHDSKTRLQVAQETATWLMQELPPDSDVSVVDSRPGSAVFAVDLSAAAKTIERLQLTGAPQPLVDVVDQSVQLAHGSKKGRKEVYIFTDLTRSSWVTDAQAAFRRRLDEHSDVLLYVIDVGVAKPQNFSLGALQLSNHTLRKSGELTVQTEIASVGISGTRTIEMLLEDPDATRPVIQDGKPLLPVPRARGQQICELAAGGSQSLQFQVRGMPLGVHQGLVRIVGEDGLALDNVRHFTVEVQEAWPVLVVAPPGVLTKFLTEAIAPYEFRQTGQARFECQVVPQATLANKNLAEFAAVCLVDPSPLTSTEWEQLTAFVTGGGGLAIFLGHHAQPPTSFNEAAPQQLLGGPLSRQWRSAAGDLYLSPRNLDHPITVAFRAQATSIPWDQLPVFRHWVLEPLAADTRIIINFGNNKPAVVERQLGRGHVLTMTTPISEPAQPRGRESWNELWTGGEFWPTFMLANEMLLYLVNSGESRLNYLAGQTAVLANNTEQDPERYQLFTPSDEPQEVTARAGRLTVKFTDTPGAYRLKGFRGEPVIRGFSVNLPPHASDLTRIGKEQLDELLGPQRYRFATTREEINRDIGEARVGREFYPYLLVGVALLLALEHLLANRFYRKEERTAQPS